MQEQLQSFVGRLYPEASSISIVDLAPIAGGFSRETYQFDALVHNGAEEQRLPMLLRKDPPDVMAILKTSRKTEHNLIEAVRHHTAVPVSRSYGYEMDATLFGEPAMILERAQGNPSTSDLFHDGPDTDQADDVMRHLCEVLVELHRADVGTLNVDGDLEDPRGVGITASSWDAYMDSTFEYYLDSYQSLRTDPTIVVMLDAFLTLRRHKPRPMPLAVVHGDFNPANFMYADGKVTAMFDWENSRIGDPREDLGWMMTMDILSNTSVMEHPVDEGGFLAYYNKLTGNDITLEELGYFTLFGTANIAVPVNSAIKRRLDGEHDGFLHMYMMTSSLAALPGLAALLGYPGVQA